MLSVCSVREQVALRHEVWDDSDWANGSLRGKIPNANDIAKLSFVKVIEGIFTGALKTQSFETEGAD